MLELIINDKQVLLPQDCEVVANLSNPIFEDREENTYPFTVSLSANRHIWGYIDRFTMNDFPVMDATLKCGRFNIIGNAYVSGISGDEIEIFISTDNKSFWGRISNMYLDSLQLEKIHISDDPATFFTEVVKTDSKNYVLGEIKIKDESYNTWNRVKEMFVGTNFILFPRLTCILNAIMSHLEYTLETDVLDYIKNVVFVNRNKTILGTTYELNQCLPHIKIDDFLKDLELRFNLSFFANDRDKKIVLTSRYRIFTNDSLSLESTDYPIKTIEDVNIGTIKYSSAAIDEETIGIDSYDIKIGNGSDNQDISLISASFGEGGTGFSEKFTAIVDNQNVNGTAYYTIPHILISSEDNENTELRYGQWRGMHEIEVGGEAFLDKNTGSISDYDWVVIRMIKIPNINPLKIYSSLLMNWNYDSLLLKNVLKKINSNVKINLDISKPGIIYKPSNLFENTFIVRGQKIGVKTQEISMNINGITSHNIAVVPL